MRALHVLALSMALAATASSQDARPTQDDIDKAVTQALKSLKISQWNHLDNLKGWGDELVLLAYLHGGMSQDDPDFKRRLARLLQPSPDFARAEYKIRSVEQVALRAMVLEELDRVKYQDHIWFCAQALVDFQNQDGGWPQGDPVGVPETFPPLPRTKVKAEPADTRPGGREKPPIAFKIPVKKSKPSQPTSRDIEYSIFAALGLKACQDAGITIPKNVLEKAATFLRESQKDGGWPRFHKEGEPVLNETTGALGALVSYHAMLGTDWTKDKTVDAGLSWLTKNYDARGSFLYMRHGSHIFRLYLERVAGLCGLEKIGDHDWNVEGVTALIKEQHPSGAWRDSDKVPKRTPGIEDISVMIDTCYAVLFLKRISQSSRVKTATGK